MTTALAERSARRRAQRASEPPRGLSVSHKLALPPSTVTSTLIVYGAKGMGKRLALDTPLATPTGWTTMGEVQPGDTLFDERGQPCRVTYVSPVHAGDSYRVTFSDGSVIVADAEHLWQTTTYAPGMRHRRTVVRTTVEIRDTLLTRQGSQVRRTHAVPTTASLELPEGELPIPPYTLGCWLGDGRSQGAYLTTADPEVLEEIWAESVHVEKPLVTDNSGRAHTYFLGATGPRGGDPATHSSSLQARLRRLGLLGNKHVPAIYLRSSARQRLALLQGLLDTDGYFNSNGSVAEFDNTNLALADAVYELVVSLGMKATRSKRQTKLAGRITGTSYRVRFVPTMPVFRIRRKAPNWRPEASQQRRRSHRYIAAVTPVEPVPMRCIAVNSPSHLYLAGRAMVPTHNTNFGSVLAEELKTAWLRFSVVDPVGVWWGLQYDASGKGPGIEVLVLGGLHGNLPIEPTAGAVVADLVADEEVDVVIDISRHANGKMWSQGEKIRFVTDYATRLYERQGERMRPVMQIFDEAGRFVPQTIPSNAPHIMACVGAIEQLVELGRNAGIGVTLITQRSARMNKSVSELADLMIAFRTVGPRSVQAILDWFGEHIPKERWKGLIEQLRALPVGTALFVSPGWLQFEGPVVIRPRATFDSSATPTAVPRLTSGRAATPDLAKYRELMAATIEKAQANDPRELQKRIRQLEQQLARQALPAPVAVDNGAVEALRQEVAARDELTRTLRAKLSEAQTQYEHLRDSVAAWSSLARGLIDELSGIVAPAALSLAVPPAETSAPVTTRPMPGPSRPLPGASRPVPPTSRRRAPAASPPTPVPTGESERALGDSSDGEVKLGSGEKKILQILAQFPEGRTHGQLAMLTGYSSKKSTVGVMLSKLRRRGYVTVGGDPQITDAGRQLVVDVEPLPVGGHALLDYWRRRLGGSVQRVLDVLVEQYPDDLSHEELCRLTGYEPDKSTLGVVLSKLRLVGLVERSARRLSDDFYDAIQ